MSSISAISAIAQNTQSYTRSIQKTADGFATSFERTLNNGKTITGSKDFSNNGNGSFSVDASRTGRDGKSYSASGTYTPGQNSGVSLPLAPVIAPVSPLQPTSPLLPLDQSV